MPQDIRDADVPAGRLARPKSSSQTTSRAISKVGFNTESSDPELHYALQRLMALHEGSAGVKDVIACGRRATPALQKILLRTEPSGILVQRLRAVAALTALGATDVLIAYLKTTHTSPESKSREEEETVINVAAVALRGSRDASVLPVLLKLAKRRPLTGVIEALGSCSQPEAIPGLINGLYEDESRRAAAAALLRLGRVTRPALLRVAAPIPNRRENASGLGARRCATELLAQIGVAPWQKSELQGLIWDPDAEISLHACRASLVAATPVERDEIMSRLVTLVPRLRSPASETAQNLLRDQNAPLERKPEAICITISEPAARRSRASRPLMHLGRRADTSHD